MREVLLRVTRLGLNSHTYSLELCPRTKTGPRDINGTSQSLAIYSFLHIDGLMWEAQAPAPGARKKGAQYPQ